MNEPLNNLCTDVLQANWDMHDWVGIAEVSSDTRKSNDSLHSDSDYDFVSEVDINKFPSRKSASTSVCSIGVQTDDYSNVNRKGKLISILQATFIPPSILCIVYGAGIISLMILKSKR
ncbi:hypothetical protein GJ496_005341 [Pomphorhynchus laevis]|nr:hypothetical protein GJ496_005341 [Pomphorhynchus laevis]